jgi:hypothetical protein
MPAPFSIHPIIMAHTRNQELESRFNTMQFGLLETQQEVQQLSATIASRDASMNASIKCIRAVHNDGSQTRTDHLA